MSIDATIAKIPSMREVERTQLRENAEARLEDPKSGADARAVLDALDRQTCKENAELAERVRGQTIAERISEAFSNDPLTDRERELVQVLLDNPGLTSEGLSRKLGWKAQAWHLHFGKMCRRREKRLWPAEPSQHRDDAFFSGILAGWSKDDGWRIKPDVVEAFAKLGLGPRNLPDK